jgi:hypothetical protein
MSVVVNRSRDNVLRISATPQFSQHIEGGVAHCTRDIFASRFTVRLAAGLGSVDFLEPVRIGPKRELAFIGRRSVGKLLVRSIYQEGSVADFPTINRQNPHIRTTPRTVRSRRFS